MYFEDKAEARRCLITCYIEQIGALRAHLFYQPYSPEQIPQTVSAESESSEIFQTVSGEFDQSPQQPICQTLSGKKKTGKEYYNSLLVLFS